MEHEKIDGIQLTSGVMKDIDYWMEFLTRMGIPCIVVDDSEYDVDNDRVVDYKRIQVGVRESYLSEYKTPEYNKLFRTNCQPSLDIDFNSDGKFVGFSPTGS